MKTVWTKGLDKLDSIELKGDYKGCLTTRKRLTKLCLDKVKESSTSSRNKDDYDCANWAYKQADSIGYQRALHEIVGLLAEAKKK
jgi:hypothetical protein